MAALSIFGSYAQDRCEGCNCTLQLLKFKPNYPVPTKKGANAAEGQAARFDMKQKDIAERARRLGIRSVPDVVIDGVLADCCAGRGPNEGTLRSAGLGQPLA